MFSAAYAQDDIMVFFGNCHHIKRRKTVTITARRDFVQVQPLTRSTYRQQIFSRPRRPYQVCCYNFEVLKFPLYGSRVIPASYNPSLTRQM